MQNAATAPVPPSAAKEVAALMQASRRQPGNAAIHADIAALFNDLQRPDMAVGAAILATELAPNSARAQAELGRALFLAGQAEAALQPCARAVALAPGNLGAVVTFGAVLFTLGQLEGALQAAVEAVALSPGHFQARVNLALALEGLGRLDEAEAQARRALSINPASAPARHNLAGLRLSRGKLDAESWSLYEARLELTPQARALSAIPRWSGEDIRGRTVLLHAEQGLGDVIQFARYAPLVRQRGARVLLATTRPLLRLFRSLPGVDEVIDIAETPAFDVFCPIASLPGLFATTLDTIPAPIPYLSAQPGRQARSPPNTLRHVGLVWAGNPGFVHDRLRSIDPAALRILHGTPGIHFHSLQKDTPPPFPMQDNMPTVSDFQDTANLIAELDLVIAVDTAVAHLAGAMGKPVWLLSRFMGCWRWLRDQDTTPWYPTMRILRQPRPGDWTSVLTRVRDQLTAAGTPS